MAEGLEMTVGSRAQRPRFRWSERVVVTGGSALFVLVALSAAVVQGRLAGFQHPGSELILAVALLSAGYVITRRYPRHAVGRLFLWSGLLASISQVAGQFDVDTSELLFLTWGLAVAAIARFPSGEWVSTVTKWAFVGFAAGFGAQAAIWRVVPLLLEPEAEADPPGWVFAGLTVASVCGVLVVVSVVVGLIQKGRRDPVLRRQIGVVVLGGLVGMVLLQPAARWLEGADRALEAGLLNSVSIILFPISVVVAITRYRLYEIDRVVSRVIAYSGVVSVLAVVYFGVLYLLSSSLPFESELAVAASTVASVAAFNPVRRRVQAFVDRRFFRSRYDAVEVVRSFAGRMSGPMDGDRLAGELEGVLDATMRPESVGVWLRGEG